MGEEGPWELVVGTDTVDAAFGSIGDIGKVVADEVPPNPIQQGPN